MDNRAAGDGNARTFSGMSTRIVSFCTDLIVRSGPLPLDHLACHVRDAGLSKARNPETPVRTALGRADDILELPDGRFDAARRMLDGAVLTHRVRAATTGRRVLFAGPELALFDQLFAAGPVPLASGGEVRRGSGEIDGLVGPDGWLPEVGADTLLAVRFAAGAISVEPVRAEPAALTERADRMRAALARHGPAADVRPGARTSSWSGQWAYTGPDDWPGIGRAGEEWRRRLLRATLRALHELPDLLSEPMPPLDEVLGFPEISWSQAWQEHARSHDLHGGPAARSVRLVLPAVPQSLRDALGRMAGAAGIPVEELAVLQLAAASYRWEGPCRHDAEQAWLDRFAQQERGRTQPSYDGEFRDTYEELFGDDGPQLGVVR